MRSSRFRCLVALMALLVAVCWALPASAAPAVTLRIAKITAVDGEVNVLKAGGEKTFKAFKGLGLTEGDSIITGEDASVKIELDQWKDISIGENSQVLISELKEVLEQGSEQTTFSLLAGGLWGSIRKQLNLDSRFQIKTPTAVMGIRGTELYVRHSEDGTQVDLIEGEIVVASIHATENDDGTVGERRVETVMRAGQHIDLDAPAEEIADFIFEELAPEGLDDFALEMLTEIAETRPEVVTLELVAQVQTIVEQRQSEQVDQPPVTPPPSMQIIYDERVAPPAGPSQGASDDQPTTPRASLPAIADQTVAVGETIEVSVPVSPSQAQITVENLTSALNCTIVPATYAQHAVLKLTGVTAGTHTVTVRAAMTGYRDAVRSFQVTVTEANNAPVVVNVMIEGQPPAIGNTLTASYVFTDPDGHSEGDTLVQWYRGTELDGSNRHPITGATASSYALTVADQEQHLWAEVTPVDEYGKTGTAVFSGAVGPVAAHTDTPPEIADLTVQGDPYVAETVWVDYSYEDAEDDPEQGTTFQWYWADEPSAADDQWVAIPGADQQSYSPVEENLNRHLRCLVVPANQHGAGMPVSGPAIGPVGYERLSLDIPTYPDQTVALGGAHLRLPVPASPAYLQNQANYRWTFSVPDIAGAAIGKDNSPAFLVIGGQAVGETDIHLQITDPDGQYKTIRQTFRITVVPADDPPVVSNVQIGGEPGIGGKLTADYVFSDPAGQNEGQSWYEWSRSDTPDGGKVRIDHAYQATYTMTEADRDKHIWLKVRPYDQYGTPGESVETGPIGPVGDFVPVAEFEEMTMVVGEWSYQMTDVQLDISDQHVSVTSSSNCVTVSRERESSTMFITLQANSEGAAIITVNFNYPGYVQTVRRFTVNVTNQAPNVQSLLLGGSPKVGESLTLGYGFADPDGHAEGASEIRWYRGQAGDGSDRQLIEDEAVVTYTLTALDEGMYIWAEVTPVDEYGKAGDAVLSPSAGPVLPEDSLWVPVGQELSYEGWDTPEALQLQADDAGNLYLLYRDGGDYGSGRPYVVKYDGTSWTSLGQVCSRTVNCMSLDVDQGIPYVAYSSFASGEYAKVKRYVDGAWEQLGGYFSGYTVHSDNALALAVEDGVPYVAFSDSDSDAWKRHYLTVKRLSGSSWIPLGNEAFSPNQVSATSIELLDGVPYVAYLDSSTGRPTVIKYEAGWETVGSADFSDSEIRRVLDLKFQNNVPLISFVTYDEGPSIMRFDTISGDWVSAAPHGFGATGVTSVQMEPLSDGSLLAAFSDMSLSGLERVTLMRYADSEWNHFSGTGIEDASQQSLLVQSNMIYLAYRDVTDATLLVVKCAVPTQPGPKLAQIEQPIWFPPGIISWAPMHDAAGYSVSLYRNGERYLVTNVAKSLNYLDLVEVLAEAGQADYTVRVRAIGDGVEYTDGPLSPESDVQQLLPLAQVAQPVLDGTVVSWDSVADASGYELALYRIPEGEHEEVWTKVVLSSDESAFDIAEIIRLSEQRDGGAASYQVSVTALGNGLFIDGAPSSLLAVHVSRSPGQVSGLEVRDVDDNGDGSDFEISFGPVTDETLVKEYRVYFLPYPPDVLNAGVMRGIPDGRAITVPKNGGPYVIRPAANACDSEGHGLVEDKDYYVVVVAVADGEHATVDGLIAAADAVELASGNLLFTEVYATTWYVNLQFNAYVEELATDPLNPEDFEAVVYSESASPRKLSIADVSCFNRQVQLELNDSLGVWDTVAQVEVNIRADKAYKIRAFTQDDAIGAPLSSNTVLTRWSELLDDVAPEAVDSLVQDSNSRQVIVGIADTSRHDQRDLSAWFSDARLYRLTSWYDCRKWLRIDNPEVLSVVYQSGQLMINLRDASSVELPEAISIYLDGIRDWCDNRLDTSSTLLIEDMGDYWQASWEEAF